jgi:hypothetical protein
MEDKREFIYILRDDKKEHYDAKLLFWDEETAKLLKNKQIYTTQELIDLSKKDISHIVRNDKQGLKRRWECIRTNSIRDVMF